MISKQDIIDLSFRYNITHRVTESDVREANELQKMVESRDEVPTPGDVIICKGPSKVYNSGHLEREPKEYSSVCTQPYVPFVFKNIDETDVYFSTSGGYWFSVPDEKILIYRGKREKIFKTWGHCGPCANGAFHFPAVVNVWEVFLESIY